jgi:hypothetical protein
MTIDLMTNDSPQLPLTKIKPIPPPIQYAMIVLDLQLPL